MLLHVRVTPNAKRNQVVKEYGMLKVRLSAPAVDGKANSALVEVLAGHFGVKRSRVRILRGLKSRDKVVEVTS